VEILFKYFDITNEEKFSYDRFLSVIREDHLNLDMIKQKMDAYMEKTNLSLDAFYSQFANVRGQLMLRDLGRMMTAIKFDVTDDQLNELFEFLDS
jgi:Ca2+-binding EF-hand superfamily protein